MSRRIAGALLVVAIAGAGCGSDRAREVAAENRPFRQPKVEDPGPIHVHGLGVNPADGSLFVATHTGLFRAEAGKLRATRVAGRYQDTMGFTVVGKNTFLGSGHPDLREKLPPFLGLIRSTDAGQTWTPVSRLGKSDFHVLEAAGGRVYGYGSDFDTRRQQLLVSRDRGATWRQAKLPERPSPDIAQEALLSLAIDPRNAAHVIASGPRAVWRSDDEGRSWKLASTEPGRLAWPEPETLYRVDGKGDTTVSADAGKTWRPLGNAGGPPAAFEMVSGQLLVALHDGTIKQSPDGKSWDVRSRP